MRYKKNDGKAFFMWFLTSRLQHYMAITDILHTHGLRHKLEFLHIVIITFDETLRGTGPSCHTPLFLW